MENEERMEMNIMLNDRRVFFTVKVLLMKLFLIFERSLHVRVCGRDRVRNAQTSETRQ